MVSVKKTVGEIMALLAHHKAEAVLTEFKWPACSGQFSDQHRVRTSYFWVCGKDGMPGLRFGARYYFCLQDIVRYFSKTKAFPTQTTGPGHPRKQGKE
jgi:hypothetical protein